MVDAELLADRAELVRAVIERDALIEEMREEITALSQHGEEIREALGWARCEECGDYIENEPWEIDEGDLVHRRCARDEEFEFEGEVLERSTRCAIASSARCRRG